MIAPIQIDDADDPRIAPFRALRDRDLRESGGAFIAEGRVVLDVLLSQSRFSLEAGLVLDRKLPGLAGMLDRWPGAAPLYVAAQGVIDAIAGFHLHRGVLALGRENEVETPDALLARLPAEALVVAAVGMANHDNVGALLRNAAAFDADAALFDSSSCDPLYRKAIRVSVGAALQTPFVRAGSGNDVVGALERHGFAIWALSPAGAEDLHRMKPPPRLALLVGTEGQGLPAEMLGRLQTVRVRMSSRFDSLNVAAATAIALHHARTAG